MHSSNSVIPCIASGCSPQPQNKLCPWAVEGEGANRRLFLMCSTGIAEIGVPEGGSNCQKSPRNITLVLPKGLDSDVPLFLETFPEVKIQLSKWARANTAGISCDSVSNYL